MGGRLCMPSYQSLCFLSSSSQPSASSLATTLTGARLTASRCNQRERLTRRISWSVPLLFLPGDDNAVSSPKESTDQRTIVLNVAVSPIRFHMPKRGRKTKWRPTCTRVFKRSPYSLRKGFISERSCISCHSIAASRNSWSSSVK